MDDLELVYSQHNLQAYGIEGWNAFLVKAGKWKESNSHGEKNKHVVSWQHGYGATKEEALKDFIEKLLLKQLRDNNINMFQLNCAIEQGLGEQP